MVMTIMQSTYSSCRNKNRWYTGVVLMVKLCNVLFVLVFIRNNKVNLGLTSGSQSYDRIVDVARGILANT